MTSQPTESKQVEWKAELPPRGWKGWAKRPEMPKAEPVLIERMGDELHGLNGGGYYGITALALERGWRFGPRMPTVQECAALERRPARAEGALERLDSWMRSGEPRWLYQLLPKGDGYELCLTNGQRTWQYEGASSAAAIHKALDAAGAPAAGAEKKDEHDE